MKFFEKIKEENGSRILKILGIQILKYKKKVKNDPIEVPRYDFFSYLWQIQRVKNLHAQVFPKFKNIYMGKDVVIIATGPSLNNYIPIENAIHIGVNKSYLAKNFTLDYLFMQDYCAVNSYIEDTFFYKNEKLIRFYGITPTHDIPNFVIPESIAIRHNALRYYAHATISKTPELPDKFAFDLSSEELYGKGSTVFPAIQFALWTNPRRIYLVGCDCSASGHFDSKDNSVASADLVQHYEYLKKFVSEYYPETEIISVNPVGLKGLFKDVYTELYLTEHPEKRE